MNLSHLFASPEMAILFKWTGLLALGWAAHWALRRRHARWRLILWRGILFFGLALPLAHFFQVPGLKIPIPGAAVAGTGLAAPLSPAAAVNPVQPAVSMGQAPPTPGAAISTSGSGNSVQISPSAKSVPWGSLLLLTWALGCGFGAFRLFRLHLQLFRLRKETCRPSPDLQQVAKQIQVRLNARRQVEVQISDAVTSPFLCGLFNPAIILPRTLAQNLSPGEMCALLSHEIAHLRQNDLVWCVAWRWMKAVCWFHPLVWKVPAAHNLACEQEADRIASGQLDEQDSYAQLLARLALRVLALPDVETKLTLNGSSQIARRLNHLGLMGSDAWNWRHSAAGLGLVGLLFLMSAGFDFSKAGPAELPVKMMRRAQAWTLAEPDAAAGAAATNQSGSGLTIEMRDGSRIIGKALDDALSFHSAALGDLKLPWAGIRSIEYAGANTNVARLTATNGDIYGVQFMASAVRVETSFGETELPVKMIRSVKVSAAGRSGQMASGLVARWTGDGNAKDSAGHFDGEVSGGVSYVAGPTGKAFQFNGGESQVDFGKSAGNFGTGDLTIAYWMKTDSRNPVEAFLAKRAACDGASSLWEIRVGPRGYPPGTLCIELTGAYRPSYAMVSSHSVNDGQWHHIAWVRQTDDSGSVKGLIYVDGALDNSTPFREAVDVSNQTPLVLGQSICQCCDGTRPYSGAAADLQLFNQALSAEEIATIYLAGKPGH